jgi:hypothetical protein
MCTEERQLFVGSMLFLQILVYVTVREEIPFSVIKSRQLLVIGRITSGVKKCYDHLLIWLNHFMESTPYQQMEFFISGQWQTQQVLRAWAC